MLRNGSNGRPTRQAIAGKECGTLTATHILDVIVSQNYRCALTGWELKPNNASLDHIVPLCKGGEHVASNAQVLHSDVNRAKGMMDQDEFVRLCCAVADWVRGH